MRKLSDQRLPVFEWLPFLGWIIAGGLVATSLTLFWLRIRDAGLAPGVFP